MTRSGTGLEGDFIDNKLKLVAIMTYIPKAMMRNGRLRSIVHLGRMVFATVKRLYISTIDQTITTNVDSRMMAEKTVRVLVKGDDSTEQ